MVGVGEVSHSAFISLLLIDISIWAKAKNIFTEQQSNVVHDRHIDIINRLLFFNRQSGGELNAFSREHTDRHCQYRSAGYYCPG